MLPCCWSATNEATYSAIAPHVFRAGSGVCTKLSVQVQGGTSWCLRMVALLGRLGGPSDAAKTPCLPAEFAATSATPPHPPRCVGHHRCAVADVADFWGGAAPFFFLAVGQAQAFRIRFAGDALSHDLSRCDARTAQRRTQHLQSVVQYSHVLSRVDNDLVDFLKKVLGGLGWTPASRSSMGIALSHGRLKTSCSCVPLRSHF